MIKKLLLTYCCLCSLCIANAQWIELGTGANALSANQQINAVAVDHSGNVYAGGNFYNSRNNSYVGKWNGSKWTELGGNNGIGGDGANINSIAVDNSGNVYAAGVFSDNNGYYYVAKWTGSKWIELIGNTGTGDSLKANNYITTITVDSSGNVYAAGAFTDAANGLAGFYMGNNYVAKWNGSSWSKLGSIISANGKGDIQAIAVDNIGNVYAAGTATDTGGYYYVAKWDGIEWMELAGTSSVDSLKANNSISSLAVDDSGNVYAGGSFTNANGYAYVAKWNGSNWSELAGQGSDDSLKGNAGINVIAIDSSGNLYVQNVYIKGALYGYEYIEKWNGTTWNPLGTGNNALGSGGEIFSIVVDDSGNVYVAGDFLDPTSHQYVAEFKQTPIITGITIASINSAAVNIYPNPANDSFTINAPEGGQVTVYSALGQLVATQNIPTGNTTIALDNIATGIYTVILTGQTNAYPAVKLVKN